MQIPQGKTEDMKGMKSYGIVIATHMPPENFFDTIDKLAATLNLHAYVVDTSDNATSQKIQEHIQRAKKKNQTLNIKYYKISNGGIGYTYNFGIKKAINDNCNPITLFTDDVRVINSLPTENICRFFEANCDPSKDALVLPQNPEEIDIKKTRAADSGLTFSAQLFKKVRFREEFILDQIDFDFSRQIRQNGGKFVVYPQVVIDVLPIGREVQKGEHVLPFWRLYLLTRNSITMSLESEAKLEELKDETLSQILHWGLSGFRSGQSVFLVFKAVFFGCIDGFTKHLGVTAFLQNLSGNRFSKHQGAILPGIGS
jgi:hypothetical protein